MKFREVLFCTQKKSSVVQFFPGSQIIAGSLYTLSLSTAFGSNLILEGNPTTNHMTIHLENISTGLLPALAITIVDNHTPVVKQSHELRDHAGDTTDCRGTSIIMKHELLNLQQQPPISGEILI